MKGRSLVGRCGAIALALTVVAIGGPRVIEAQEDLPGVELGLFYTNTYLPALAVQPFSGSFGGDAIASQVEAIVGRDMRNSDRFEVLDTFARGPMVINERIDYFSNFAIKTWHGVGVFFIRDNKIVDWYDYTIEMEQA